VLYQLSYTRRYLVYLPAFR